MMMQRGCLAFLLVLLSSTIQYTAAQGCLPNLNDGGVLEFWDMVPGQRVDQSIACPSDTVARLRLVHVDVYFSGKLIVRDHANQELHVVESDRHLTSDDANEVDVLAPTNILHITVEPSVGSSSSSAQASRVWLLYKCELPGGTQVADYYSAGVLLHQVTTHQPIAQEFVARHSRGFLVNLNLGVSSFTGSIRILKGRLGDSGCPALIHEEVGVSIGENGAGVANHATVVDGSPYQNQGLSGSNLQLIRLSRAIYMEGNAEYIVELVPDTFTSMKVDFTSGIGYDMKHNLQAVHSDLAVGIELVTFVPGLLKRDDVILSMDNSDTAVLDTDSMMNQPSISMHHATNALMYVQYPVIEVVVVQQSRSIIQVGLQQVGVDRWRIGISGLKAGIDTIEIYNSNSMELLSMVTVYVVQPVTVSASLQYVAELEWPNPNNFYAGWEHNPTTTLGETKSLVEQVFGPLGIQFSFQNNGLVPIAGLDANGDQEMSNFDEWTTTPLMTQNNPRHYPSNFNDFFVNIYAIRNFADTQLGGSQNGGGTSRPTPPGSSLACGAFVKTWKNRDDASVASTLLHEVGHCLGLAHNEEWDNYAAMDLGNSATRQNVMSVGRSDDHRLSPRQWLTVREYARLHGTGQSFQTTLFGNCDCDERYPCLDSNACIGTGNAGDYSDPYNGLERCNNGICLGSRQYFTIDELLAESNTQRTICASTYEGLLPNVCNGSHLTVSAVPLQGPPTAPPVTQPTPLPTPSPTPWPTQPPTPPPVPSVALLPSAFPTGSPAPSPTPSDEPLPTSKRPTLQPTNAPTIRPTASPTTATPSSSPIMVATPGPSPAPTPVPSPSPTPGPSPSPTVVATSPPVLSPSSSPTKRPVTSTSPPRYTNSPTIPVFNQDGCVDFHLDLHLDRHPADTSWKIIERTHGTVAEGSNYRDGYGTIEFRECLSIYGCYVFELYDTFKDGLCCTPQGEGGSFTVNINDHELLTGERFGDMMSSVSFGTCLPQKTCDDGYHYELELLADNFPTDTSWEISSSDGTVVASSLIYSEARTMRTDSGCLPAGDCYEMKIMDKFNNGICCDSTFGRFALTIDGIRHWTGGEFGSETTSPTIGNCPVP